jgi:fumarylacetoacetase
MPITANDTNRKSWLEVPANSDFLFKTYLLSFSNQRKYSDCRNKNWWFRHWPWCLTTIKLFWRHWTYMICSCKILWMILFQMVKTWRLVRNRIAELLMPQTTLIMQKILTLSFLEWKMSKCNYQFLLHWFFSVKNTLQTWKNVPRPRKCIIA